MPNVNSRNGRVAVPDRESGGRCLMLCGRGSGPGSGPLCCAVFHCRSAREGWPFLDVTVAKWQSGKRSGTVAPTFPDWAM